MAKAETDITHKVMLEGSKHGAVLFKNVRGMFLTLDGQHRIKAGLMCKGASDLIGYIPTKITAEMVGKTVAIFTALEIKTAKGLIRPEQTDFIERVQARGGVASVIRRPEEAKFLLNK